ncbi:MAG: hypothetical protein A3J93_01160 [Candidatus Magasanikbacteria bacterium RIFOXYC2_FULL_42_28]|uniref:Methyltransferase domain-containing protein n=1 Tax=Candidatus Magasanikbacteria bacterium RIFOXYC2_FULL_42_28 TaxID=1798704 RepID=A0A1F6NXM4_9BACT|nr:MAG: hypothetical protein A3J93_01160 [Candidatus Magasanikbacteria bacterium RIFOXYC2_FULL_42_28]
MENQVLTKKSNILTLHPNHRLLYETVLLLKPAKIVECGVGGGDHLYNLNILDPKIDSYGVDRGQAQLDYCVERSPSLKGKVQNFDMTMPLSSKLPLVDVAFTQAVIMHIKTGNGHLVALSNLFKLASEQVVLMENWSNHPFMEDIKYMFNNGMLPWQSIYFYIRRAPEYQNKPHLMIVSSRELPFEPLKYYSQLLSDVNNA